MPDTYTVRLEDGSEIGPLDLPAVREWYARGLIHADSPVLSPGSQRWVALRHVGVVPGAAGARTAAKAGARPAPARPAPRPAAPAAARPASAPSSEPTRSRAFVTAVAAVVVLAAGAAAWWGLRAGEATASAEDVPSAAVTEADAAAARLGAERRAEAVRHAVEAVPHLTPRCAEVLMSRSQAEVLLPEETFRRSQVALRRGLPALSPAETREVSRLTSAVHGRVSARDRGRLATYLTRVKEGLATSPEDDRAMAQAVRTAELRLPARDLERLRALYEKATLGAP
jgi:hypothetical protein